MTQSTFIESVREQYEALPYPPRDPENERSKLITTLGDTLPSLNHWCFKGKKDFSSGFRCLVAGGGTGDSAIYLAEQLRHTDAEVVYLDMSRASRQVAEARARVRGLTNITWLTDSLLSLPDLDLGLFDYVNCSGVLHHLASPEAGLAVLRSVLKDDGAMFLMVYAKYGRQGVYLLQSLFRKLIPADLPIDERVRLARQVLSALPKANLFARDKDLLKFWQHEIGDAGYGDSGLYDLLLHTVDRCYDVSEVYSLAESAQLNLVRFLGERSQKYDPDALVADQKSRALWASLPIRERHAVAEELDSQHVKHSFYVTPQTETEAQLSDEALAPTLIGALEGKQLELYEAIQPDHQLTLTIEQYGEKQIIALQGNAILKHCVRYMDGNTATDKLIRKVVLKTNASQVAVRAELKRLFAALLPGDMVCLAQPMQDAARA